MRLPVERISIFTSFILAGKEGMSTTATSTVKRCTSISIRVINYIISVVS